MTQSYQVYITLNGLYTGIEPGTTNVYSNRKTGGPWEQATLELHDDGHWSVTYNAAKLVLSIQPNGSLDSRPAGTFSGYEQLWATTQPDELSIVYRNGASVYLGIEVISSEGK